MDSTENLNVWNKVPKWSKRFILIPRGDHGSVLDRVCAKLVTNLTKLNFQTHHWLVKESSWIGWFFARQGSGLGQSRIGRKFGGSGLKLAMSDKILLDLDEISLDLEEILPNLDKISPDLDKISPNLARFDWGIPQAVEIGGILVGELV